MISTVLMSFIKINNTEKEAIMRKNIFVSLISCAALALLLPVINQFNKPAPISPDRRFNYVKYMDPSDLIATSDLIINGTVQSQSLMTLNINLDPSDTPLYIDYMVVDVLITDVIYGDQQIGNTVQVKYPTSDTLDQYKKLNADLSPDNDVILFLKEYGTLPCSIVSPHQGVINLTSQFDEDTISLKNEYNIYELFSYDSKEELIDILKAFY